jgi:hypothetical protein
MSQPRLAAPPLLDSLELNGLVRAGQADQRVHDAAQDCAVAEQGCHKVKAGHPHQTPVEGADYNQDCRRYIDRLHRNTPANDQKSFISFTN